VSAESAKRAYRPPRALILGTREHFIAFGFGAGLSPVAPGTAGTVAAIPFWYALQWLPPALYGIALLLLFGFGCWVCGRSARLLGVHDHGGIVFDEIVGYLITCLPLLPAWHAGQAAWLWWPALAFALFRLFDIWKPWPIRIFDRSVHGGLGIMLDDAIAGLYAAALLLAAIRFF
jgi:phosphatidylglycerophosphatase A